MTIEQYKTFLSYLRDIEETVYRIEEKVNGTQTHDEDDEGDDEE